jgi:hypothetical protein
MYKELCSPRFKNGEFNDLRTRLLADLDHEPYPNEHNYEIMIL